MNIYAPGKGIVEGVEEEGVVAMRTSDPAHPRHLDQIVSASAKTINSTGDADTWGTETGVGGEGARLMILLQFGLQQRKVKKTPWKCFSHQGKNAWVLDLFLL